MDDHWEQLSGHENTAATRLRRSISAARAAEGVKAQEASYVSCKDDDADIDDDDDSSQVLYRDPSTTSTRRSRASVMSGAHQQGETFFTALKKQPPWQSAVSAAASDLCSQAVSDDFDDEGGSLCADSHANPVQSTSHSASFFSARIGDGDSCSLQDADDDGCLVVSMQAAEGSAGLQGCADGSDSGGGSYSGEQLTSSVLDVINSLYSAQAGQTWQQQQQPEPSVQGQDPAPQGVPASAAASRGFCADGGLAGELSKEASGSSSAQAAAEVQEQPQPHQDASAAAAAGAHADDAAAASAADGEGDGDGAAPDTQAVLAAVDGMLAGRSRLQVELGGYLQDLSSKADSEGQPLVQMSEDYAVLVERLLREGRAQQYRALEGWGGPHRFEDLPVAQLRSSSKDPQVAAGLAAIAKLDADLREASLKALITARALNPEQWADAEKQRLERRAAELDAALTKERQRRAHAAKLRGALSKLDEQCSQASLQSLSKASASLSYYRLKPHEEGLLAAVLARDESSLEANDPFNPMLLNWDDLHGSSSSATAAAIAGGQHSDQHAKGSSGSASAAAPDSRSFSQDGSTEVSEATVVAAASTHSVSQVPYLALFEASAAETAAAAEPGSEASVLSSRLSSSVFSLLRPSSAMQQGRRCSLAEIDDKLAAIQAERQAALCGAGNHPGLSRTASNSSTSAGLASRAFSTQHSAVSGRAPSASLQPSRIPLSPAATSDSSSSSGGGRSPARSLTAAGVSGIPAAPGTAGGTPQLSSAPSAAAALAGSSQPPRAPGCSAAGARAVVIPRSSSQAMRGDSGSSSISSAGGSSHDGSRRVSTASGNGSCRSSSTVHAIDYIREQREVKELARREQELDAQLRSLQTSELPSKLTPQQLQSLLQCAY